MKEIIYLVISVFSIIIGFMMGLTGNNTIAFLFFLVGIVGIFALSTSEQ
tara:strand:+ start:93 stop:239 length:147 start_codon:yes stop_codon:yes gene_type:complete